MFLQKNNNEKVTPFQSFKKKKKTCEKGKTGTENIKSMSKKS